jgi:hypothetical protein
MRLFDVTKPSFGEQSTESPIDADFGQKTEFRVRMNEIK